jgi:hypothetical protein
MFVEMNSLSWRPEDEIVEAAEKGKAEKDVVEAAKNGKDIMVIFYDNSIIIMLYLLLGY